MQHKARFVRPFTSSLIIALLAVACGSSRRSGFEDKPSSSDSPTGGGGGGGGVGSEGKGSASGGGFAGGPTSTPTVEAPSDPIDCKTAAENKSYVGCDYWPTVTPNPVWSIFDYAVVVANTGSADADVSVTGPNGVSRTAVVPPGELRKITLPWISALKGADFDECTSVSDLATSTVVTEGAYHLVSSIPVIVYQFNALEYRGQGGEAPDGSPKDWSTCPGNVTACQPSLFALPVKQGCFSFSNDASLLLPSTAMTNSYRVMGHNGASIAGIPELGILPTVLTVTATQPDTQVDVDLASTASVTASTLNDTVAKSEGGRTVTFKLARAGDVVQLVTENGVQADFSGSVVRSSKPVQVLSSVPCISIPSDKPACDHIEETVLPVETLGREYLVVPPTGPRGTSVTHEVKLYGNQDGTKLTYEPERPNQCPETLSAGQVADCGLVDQPFRVTADKEFGMMTFLVGASLYDSSGSDRRGDPSASFIAAVEQFRTHYVLLAPTDYPVLYADITAEVDADVALDGKPVTAPWTMIGSGPYGYFRVDLTRSGNDGAHKLTAKKPIGIEVVGYGDNTSFRYPAGLNLKMLASPITPK